MPFILDINKHENKHENEDENEQQINAEYIFKYNKHLTICLSLLQVVFTSSSLNLTRAFTLSG